MPKIIILGAGIAGLTTGWLLHQEGFDDFIILEKNPYPGGIARSFLWHDFYCDFATHRLFTYNSDILQKLLALVPMGRQVRRSKILLKNKWMRDPLDILELFAKLPINESFFIAAEYINRNKNLPQNNFENFVISRYGKSLYHLFFQPYTEKLFGIPGENISVLWAERKVRLASPLDTLRENTKTKFQYFYYPLNGGYGAIANKLYEDIKDKVRLSSTVKEFKIEDNKIKTVIYENQNQNHLIQSEMVVSTLPLSMNAKLLGNPVDLNYQSVKSVYLWINKPQVSDYHWIYFIDYKSVINRLAEFKNINPPNTPPETTVLCAEVTHNYSNDETIDKVITDLETAGLINQSEILDTKIVNENFAYPVYDLNYEQNLWKINEYLKHFANFKTIGRAAEFQHYEVDDNFEQAINLVDEITQSLNSSETIMPKTQKDVSEFTTNSVIAVILTFNHYDDTKECLESLIKSDYQDLQILIVDNGSSDGTPDKIKNKFPQVHIIENDENLGVPAGFNIGFKYALDNKAEYIFMLNNDTVLATDTISRLVKVANNDPQSGIVMPKILYYGSSNKVWSSGGKYRTFPPAILMTDKKNEFNESIRLIEYAPSTGLLIHRRAFKLAGLFDPGYFFFFDDWDFSQRVRTHGLNILYNPTAILWHKVSKTTEGTHSAFFWNTFGASITRYYRRHGRPVWVSLPVHVGYIMLREFIWKRNLKFLPFFWEGIKEGLQQPLGRLPHQ